MRRAGRPTLISVALGSLSSLLWLPLAALLLFGAILGTERLGRPLTDEEKKRFGELLEEHDYSGMRLVAMRFAYRLTRSRGRAQDLMGRVDVRLVTTGWDPGEVSLVRRLCRLVWSEWTHTDRETDKARRAEEGFLRELEVTEGFKVPSIEQRATELETAREEKSKGEVQLAKLRVLFEQAGDEVNLLWLKFELDRVTEATKMAELSGRDVAEFYAAARRRKRAIQKLLANDQGVDWKEEEP
jgi:hypothetical protein